MKVKINKNGALEIYRKNVWKKQYCPHSTIKEYGRQECSDLCPLFSEPDITEDFIFLSLCNGKFIRLKPGDFEDER